MRKSKKTFSIQVKCHQEYDDYANQPPFCWQIKLPFTRITDALCDKDEIEEWESAYPTFIDAPTGMGKSTFVYKELLPRAAKKGKNVLLLSNRRAVSNQQKYKVMDEINSRFKETLTEKGVYEQDIFDYVGVITYHRLQGFLNNEENRNWIENIEYVVCDECHFFTSDSLFNSNCDRILKLITSRFCKAIRVYLTATPWDTIHRICEAEQENYLDFRRTCVDAKRPLYLDRRYMLYYHFDRSFDKYDLKFFEDFSDILPSINSESDDKWLIFIDNKGTAEKLKNEIKVPIAYLDAESKGVKVWNELIQNEKFDSKVLLTTSVIDCGVNIIDSRLTNIVILSDDRVSIMQMAGRKRFLNGDKVNLWIQDLPKQKLVSRYLRYIKYQELEYEFDSLVTDKEKQNFIYKLWQNEDETVRVLFTVKLHSIIKNRSAFVHITRAIRFYENILSGNTTFRDEVSRWFGKELVNTNDELAQFYKNHEYKVLTEEDKEDLRLIIAREYKKQGKTEAQPRRICSLQHTALNNRLQEARLPYEIQVVNGSWKFVYFGFSDNKEEQDK